MHYILLNTGESFPYTASDKFHHYVPIFNYENAVLKTNYRHIYTVKKIKAKQYSWTNHSFTSTGGNISCYFLIRYRYSAIVKKDNCIYTFRLQTNCLYMTDRKYMFFSNFKLHLNKIH